MSAAMKVPTTFTAVDKFTSVVKKMTTGVSRFSKTGVNAVKRFDNRVTKTVKNMGRISQLAIGLGLGTLFTAAIQNNIAYNDSLASVSAITGAVGDDLVLLEKLSKKTAKAQKMLGADVLKAYELIGSAKPELLTNAELLDKVTNAAVTLSKAGRMELAPASEALTTTLNQFGLSGEYASSVIDNLAAGAKFGSSSITNTSEALAKFGTIAAATGTKVNESIALIELVSPFEKGAEAGTKLRNILSTMAGAEILPPAALKALKGAGVDIDIVTDSTIPLAKRLKEMAKLGKNSTDVMQVFGKQNTALAQALFNNVDGFDAMLANIDEVGVAQSQAATNTDTLKFALESIKTSFLNVTTATNNNSTGLSIFKDVLKFVASNMGTIVSIAAAFIAAFVTMKALVIGMRVATFAYNVVLGVNTALTQANKKALIGNTIATNAYKVAMAIGTGVTWLATAATTAFGVALNLGLWPILAIIAAVVAVIAIIKNWSAITEWFGEKWKMFTEWISGLWQSVVSWFKDFDFMEFFKNIGQSILKFMLMPLKGVLTLLAKIPGKIGELAQSGLDKIGDLTGEVDANLNNETLEAPETGQANITRESNANVNGAIDLNIRDKGNNVESTNTENSGIPIKVTSTQGAF
jgi:TP901 family phage tail tape measure protein